MMSLCGLMRIIGRSLLASSLEYSMAALELEILRNIR
jgi:hypothetical protein